MQVIDKTLNHQSVDGWFMEYDGPDLGYLSVSLDGLWDLYDVTKNEKCLKSINNATDFIVNTIDKFKDGLMIYNSRNTNYIVPYGLMRSYFHNNKSMKIYRSLKYLYQPKSNEFHFIDSTDDRYICHYIGHSFVRANNLLQTKKIKMKNYLDNSQDQIQIINNGESYRAYCITKKGGALYFKYRNKFFFDYGWDIIFNKNLFTTYWQSSFWSYKKNKKKFIIDGYLFRVNNFKNTSLKHFILRIISLLNINLNQILKFILIFRPQSKYRYKRIISLKKNKIIVQDNFNLDESAELVRSCNNSKRHTASGNTFDHNDFKRLSSVRFKEKRSLIKSNIIKITTEYEIN